MVSGGKFLAARFMEFMPNGVNQWTKRSGVATLGCRGLCVMVFSLFGKGHGAHFAGSAIGQKGRESIVYTHCRKADKV